MNKYLPYIIAIAFLSIVACTGLSSDNKSTTRHFCKVIRVVDGDTIIVLYKGKRERVRLLCVDTPESVHPNKKRNTTLGKQAARYTRRKLQGKYVSLVFERKKRGKFGRLLAYVFIHGKNFNIDLVKKGWSPYYTKYGKSQLYHRQFIDAENYAKKHKLRYWKHKL